MRYRIKVIDNVFYPQYKDFICWKDYSTFWKGERCAVWFLSLDEAKIFINQCRKDDASNKFKPTYYYFWD
jgi:hypothetical protein